MSVSVTLSLSLIYVHMCMCGACVWQQSMMALKPKMCKQFRTACSSARTYAGAQALDFAFGFIPLACTIALAY